MNCKQGEIAIVKRGYQIPAGAIVTCVERGPDGIDQHGNEVFDLWIVEYRGSTCIPGKLGCLWCARDADLRPIRDPGEDAVDQTLVPGYVRCEVPA